MQVLTEEQIKRVLNWYVEHQDYVRFLRSQEDLSYEPSQPEDKNDPRIWKGAYWNWFFERMHEERGLPIPDKIKNNSKRSSEGIDFWKNIDLPKILFYGVVGGMIFSAILLILIYFFTN